ncbi:MAG TPA: response regulator transcription factor [Arachnia sp.]|nr:response regulator transcription factor [Arachnia sp.]
MIRVGICDDDPATREALNRILERRREFVIAASVSSGEEAVAYDGDVEVWLLDVRMRGMSGIETCAALRKAVPPPAVIMMTAFPDSSVANAVSAGALGFLYKDVRPEHLVRAIRAAPKGVASLSPDAMATMANTPIMGGIDAYAFDGIVRDEVDAQLVELVLEGHSAEAMLPLIELSDSSLKKRLGKLMRRAGVSTRPLLMAKLYAAKAARDAG